MQAGNQFSRHRLTLSALVDEALAKSDGSS